MLGYDKIRVALERLKEKRSALRARLEGLRSGLPDPAELDAAAARARGAHCRPSRRTADSGGAGGGRAPARRSQTTLGNDQRLRDTATQLERELQVAQVQHRAAGERVGRLRQEADEASRAAADLAVLREQLLPRATVLAEREALDRLADAVAARRNQAVQLETARAQLARARRAIDAASARSGGEVPIPASRHRGRSWPPPPSTPATAGRRGA